MRNMFLLVRTRLLWLFSQLGRLRRRWKSDVCWRGVQRLFNAGHEFLLAMGAAIQEMMTGMNAIYVHGLGSGAASGIPDGAIHGRSVFDVCRYGLLWGWRHQIPSQPCLRHCQIIREKIGVGMKEYFVPRQDGIQQNELDEEVCARADGSTNYRQKGKTMRCFLSTMNWLDLNGYTAIRVSAMMRNTASWSIGRKATAWKRLRSSWHGSISSTIMDPRRMVSVINGRELYTCCPLKRHNFLRNSWKSLDLL